MNDDIKNYHDKKTYSGMQKVSKALRIKYLLQVWTDKGEMIFEKPLAKRVANWNISNNKFVFQETRDSQDVYVVRLCDDPVAG